MVAETNTVVVCWGDVAFTLFTHGLLNPPVVSTKVTRMRAIAGTDEDIPFSQDVWLVTELLFCFNESLHYLRTDDRAFFWWFFIPAVINLQLMTPLNKVNMATTNITDTHDVTILATVGICFKHFGGDKTNDKCRLVSLWDRNINHYGITSHLQPQYPWSDGNLLFLEENILWSMRQSRGKKKRGLTIFFNACNHWKML